MVFDKRGLAMPTVPEFALERDLVASFVSLLSTFEGAMFEEPSYALEFDYQRGRTDVVALAMDGTVVAFEAKLRDWREALHQAYRNRCFADLSYVILPMRVAERAARYEEVFSDRGVGLCCITPDGIRVLLPALHSVPLQAALKQCAVEFVSADGAGGLDYDA